MDSQKKMTVGGHHTDVPSVRIQTKGLAYLLIPLVKKIEYYIIHMYIKHGV
jgi:hypothetical protein